MYIGKGRHTTGCTYTQVRACASAIVRLETILSQEGTIHGDPLAMAMYAIMISTIPLSTGF